MLTNRNCVPLNVLTCDNKNHWPSGWVRCQFETLTRNFTRVANPTLPSRYADLLLFVGSGWCTTKDFFQTVYCDRRCQVLALVYEVTDNFIFTLFCPYFSYHLKLLGGTRPRFSSAGRLYSRKKLDHEVK